VCWHQLIVPFVYHLDLVAFKGELEQSYYPIGHELRCDRAAAHSGKLLLGETYILCGLNDPDLSLSAFRLNRNDIVTSVLVETDIEFVDLNLPNSFHRGSQVILEAIRGQSEESVDQSVVADNGEECLFVIQRIRANNFRSCVRDC